jgi:hypothetical protein
VVSSLVMLLLAYQLAYKMIAFENFFFSEFKLPPDGVPEELGLKENNHHVAMGFFDPMNTVFEEII